MTHPTREEWMAYLYGELDKKSAAPLKAHLRDCVECQTEVAAWQGAAAELDSWKLPDQRPRTAWLPQAVRWAAAAMLLLSVGYGIARLSGSAGPDTDALRRALETSLEPSLAASIRQDLRKELNAEWRDQLSATRGQLYKDTVELASAASDVTTRQLLAEFVKSYEAMRMDERQAMLTFLGELESRRLADYGQLRNGLQTLAVATGDEFLWTKQNMVRLLAYDLPAGSASGVTDDLNPSVERSWK